MAAGGQPGCLGAIRAVVPSIRIRAFAAARAHTRLPIRIARAGRSGRRGRRLEFIRLRDGHLGRLRIARRIRHRDRVVPGWQARGRLPAQPRLAPLVLEGAFAAAGLYL